MVAVNTRRMGVAASTWVSVEPALQARGLTRTLRSGDTETSVLQDVSIAVHPGELVVVTGSSPSALSTLLSCLAGSEQPDAGTVWVGGIRLSGQSEQVRARLRARWIGVVPTSGHLFGHLTVAQNVQLAPIMIAGRRPPDTMDVLTRLGIAHRCYAYPAQLSPGERARAGLAVALANDPAVLLADDPTHELDEATEGALFDELLEHPRQGKAVLVAGDRASVAAPADRALVLDNGRLSE